MHSELKGYHKNTIHCVAFNCDGRKLASSSIDNSIVIYQLDRDSNLDRTSRLSGHSADIDQIAWHPTHPDTLCSVSLDKTVKLWDIRTKSPVFSINTNSENINLAFSDPYIAVGTKDDNIHFINIKTKQIEKSLSSDVELNECRWSFDGRLLFVSTGAGTIRIYSFPELNLIHEMRAHAANVYALHIDPHGRFMASGGADAIVSLFDYQDLICINTFTKMEWPIRSVAFSGDGELLAVGSEDDHIDIVNVTTGNTEHKIDSKTPANCLAWHPTKRILAYCTDHRDSGVFLHNFE